MRLGCLLDPDHHGLRGVEGRNISKEIKGGLTHFPTWLLLIGYAVYWLELYVFNRHNGLTSPLATVIAVGLLGILVKRESMVIYHGWKLFFENFNRQSLLTKFFLAAGMLVGAVTLGCGFYASLFPPHLLQEYDVLHYHLTVPRQHLISGTFAHIPWSAADFFYLPLDYALAPFWLVTALPNKFPQFIFMLGLIAVAVRLGKEFDEFDFLSGMMIIFCILGSHSVGIQMGTAMLDITGCYLLLAALHSFLKKDVFLCVVEAAFYIWSKSFIPPMMVLIVLLMGSIFVLLRMGGPVKIGWVHAERYENFAQKYRGIFGKVVGGFFLLSLLVGGPFVLKSLYYTGTPAYPFGVGIFPRQAYWDENAGVWPAIKRNAHDLVTTKDEYGHGRSSKAFLEHFWLIAVPEQNVNNSFDYPIGLIYLLCLAPFLFILFAAFSRREFLILPVFAAGFWVVWWFASQQSRFLYVLMVLMMVIVVAVKKFRSPVFMLCIFLAMIFTCFSIIRANKADWGKSSYEVIREKDKQLLWLSRESDKIHPLEVESADVAFADFPVTIKNKGILVLK